MDATSLALIHPCALLPPTSAQPSVPVLYISPNPSSFFSRRHRWSKRYRRLDDGEDEEEEGLLLGVELQNLHVRSMRGRTSIWTSSSTTSVAENGSCVNPFEIGTEDSGRRMRCGSPVVTEGSGSGPGSSSERSGGVEESTRSEAGHAVGSLSEVGMGNSKERHGRKGTKRACAWRIVKGVARSLCPISIGYGLVV